MSLESSEKAALDKKKTAPALVREGTKIVIPERMSMDDAIKWMMIKKDEDERMVAVHAEFDKAFPLDALVQLKRATDDIFGWSATTTEMNPWTGQEEARAVMINIPVGPKGETVEVPFGEFKLPNVEGKLMTNINWSGTPSLVFGGQVKNRHVADFHKIVERTKELIKSDSIYRHKAVRVSWKWMRNGENFHPIQNAPAYLDLSTVNPRDLVFASETQKSIELGLFAPILHSHTCRAYNIPLKRGVLLEGPYGVGKTLTALATASLATGRAWTFLYLDSVLDLENGLHFAANYEPCVLFVEDIDNVLGENDDDTPETREAKRLRTRNILNILDGIDTKDREIITVFTTNFVERLDRAVMRPGRLDTVVHLDAPDAEAACRLVRLYGGGALTDDPIDWTAIGRALAGKIPAVIREVVERAKIAAIYRSEGEAIASVNGDDILGMAKLMDNHIRLIAEPKKDDVRRYSIELQPRDFNEVVKR